ncbi:hypothetical protein AA309_24900 [Microvirga vignae]|uniref:Uncharacterized protein n=1 Tax=Microvirga vignae TaxID=1225564 RepID=A0A0H1R609_9HYPH|nr:hypothetical protein [Microvirga vignae]KLK90578.1 hypothetical protein AA309_24900 [Microvirga vignae]
MSLTDDRDQAEIMQALHALLAESLVLWDARHCVQPLDTSSAIVLCDETGAPFATIEPHRPQSDLIRWSVTIVGGCSTPRPRACSSILGVLETVRAALDIPPMESSAMRLGVSPGAV